MDIDVKNVSKSYYSTFDNHLTVLKNLSFSVYSKEFLAIIGPSGCGKTTILKILAGIINPDSGKICYEPSPEVIPIVWQEHRLFPWRTVLRNIAFGLEVKGNSIKKSEQVALKFLDMVGLEDFKNSYPTQLSGGMAQRVAIARALAVTSEIILMDEPFASVDYQTKTVLIKEIKSLQKHTGITIVYVTHDVRDAIAYADRILVLSRRPAAVNEVIKVDPLAIPHLPLEEHIWKILKV